MAEYVVVDKMQLEADLTLVADSIRAKANITEKLEFPLGYKSVVDSINTSGEGGIDTSDATVTAQNLEKDVVAYGVNGKVIGEVRKSNGFGAFGITPTQGANSVSLVSIFPDSPGQRSETAISH